MLTDNYFVTYSQLYMKNIDWTFEPNCNPGSKMQNLQARRARSVQYGRSLASGPSVKCQQLLNYAFGVCLHCNL